MIRRPVFTRFFSCFITLAILIMIGVLVSCSLEPDLHNQSTSSIDLAVHMPRASESGEDNPYVQIWVLPADAMERELVESGENRVAAPTKADYESLFGTYEAAYIEKEINQQDNDSETFALDVVPGEYHVHMVAAPEPSYAASRYFDSSYIDFDNPESSLFDDPSPPIELRAGAETDVTLELQEADILLGRVFRSVWNTEEQGESNDNQITLPLLEGGSYDFIVDWGDGTRQVISDPTDFDPEGEPEVRHTYDSEGEYRVEITGQIEGFSFLSDPDNGLEVEDAPKLIEISDWGLFRPGNTGGYFAGTQNLLISATDSPDLTQTTVMSGAFSFNALEPGSNLNHWDMSAVRDMSDMFSANSQFNGDIGDWDVSSVQTVSGMFRGANSFNSDISRWDVSNVTDMSDMFRGAHEFTQDIGDWDVSSVRDMRHMLSGAESFNHDISGWDVSNVEDMERMFQNTNEFNRDIGTWDVSNVEDMERMFGDAVAFDQDLGDWEITNVANLERMFEDVALSTENYDSLLQGWADLAENVGVNEELTFDAGNSTYSEAALDARDFLTDPESGAGWTIEDGGQEGGE